MIWTLQDAKNKFSAVVDAALAGTPQEVSRRGKPAVVVLSAEDYKHLLADAVDTRGSFVDHLLAFPIRDVERSQVVPREVDF
jgi:prevent-host-death family protein